MTRTAIFPSAAFLLTLGTILGFVFLGQAPVEADASCTGMLKCTGEVTRQAWGHGATCAAAAADFQSQANAMVPTLQSYCDTDDFCGTCMTPIFQTDPCITSGSQKQVDGTVTVRCLKESFGGPGPM